MTERMGKPAKAGQGFNFAGQRAVKGAALLAAMRADPNVARRMMGLKPKKVTR